jgi:tetratricopeptide (TPR) repeat protein
MANPNDLVQQFVDLINNSITCANNHDFSGSCRKIREADQFVTAHSLQHLWHHDQIQEFVCDHCSRLATTLTDEGSDSAALELLTWQKRIYPDDFYVEYNMGRLASRRGDLIGTIAHYETAMEMDSSADVPLAHLSILVQSLAVAYQRAGELRQAISFLNSEIKKHAWAAKEKRTLEDVLAYLKGSNPDVHLVGGQEQAANTARQLADQANSFDEAGDFSKAQPLYEKAVHLAPNDPDILYNYGVACAQQSDKAWHSKARQLYLEAVRIDPQYRDAHANLAPLLLMDDDFDGAAKHARIAIELGMEEYALYVVLGQACANLGDFEEARAAFRKALTLAEPSYRHKIEEILSHLPAAGDSSQPAQAVQGAQVSSGASATRAGVEPINVINADTYPRLGKQLAEAMGKRFVEAGFGLRSSEVWEIRFTCQDGDYKAILPDDPTKKIKIFLLKEGREIEVFTIDRK